MGVMVLIILIFLVLGCLMDSLSMVILAIPFFWPVVAGLDYGLVENETEDLVRDHHPRRRRDRADHAACRASTSSSSTRWRRDVPMRETFKGVMPFFASEMVRVTLLVAFPAISLFLPRLLQ